MKAARIMVLVVAVVAGGIAVLLMSGTPDQPPPAPPPVAQIDTVDILVAKNDIGMGQTLQPQDIGWQQWPATAAAPVFIRKSGRADTAAEYVGAIARTPFAAGEPLRENRLIKGKGSGYMAAILPSGMRAFSTEISAETGAGGFILPNDRVDVILSRRDREAERATGVEQHSAETILSDVRVLAIDQTVEEKNGQRVVVGKTATLELTPRQAERLAMSRQQGTLTLALRSLADADPSKAKPEAPANDTGSGRTNMVRFGVTTTVTPKWIDHENRHMMNGKAIRKIWLGTWLIALTAVGASNFATAQSAPPKLDTSAPSISVAASDATSRFVPLGIGKSVVIDLPRDVKDVLVADPKTANAIIRTARRAYIIGVMVGQTSVVFFDAEGKQIAGLDVAVTRDLNGVRAAFRQIFPDGEIRIDGVGDGVVLTGSVANPAEAQQAFDIASRLVGDANRVVNGIIIRGRDQVLLKVTVAEVQRDVIKQLGIDLSGPLLGAPGQVGAGSTVFNFLTQNPFSATGAPLSNTFGALRHQSTAATLRAMERAGVIRTLAEPNLSAISGENATFLAGGEFPIPAGLSCDTSKVPPICQQSIEYKKFGVGLTFTPVVLSEGRISLKVMTEVSDLSNENAITLQVPGTSQSLTIPSVRVRRADTTVEIPSGGAMAMAGMIQEQTKQQINGLPGLMQLPVLGTLFRSRDYQNRQTELMVIVMPYIVRSVASKDLSRPDDGFADVSDPSTILLGRLNRIYGLPGTVDPNKLYRGSYGFILD